MTLDELFTDSHLLPTVPKVVFDLIELLRNEDAAVSVVARKIELDQVLTARVLRMANSPYFGLRRRSCRSRTRSSCWASPRSAPWW